MAISSVDTLMVVTIITSSQFAAIIIARILIVVAEIKCLTCSCYTIKSIDCCSFVLAYQASAAVNGRIN